MIVRLTVCVLMALDPEVVAEMVVVVERGVPETVWKIKLAVARKLLTDADGKKLQVTPAGMPLGGHASVTVPLNVP